MTIMSTSLLPARFVASRISPPKPRDPASLLLYLGGLVVSLPPKPSIEYSQVSDLAWPSTGDGGYRVELGSRRVFIESTSTILVRIISTPPRAEEPPVEALSALVVRAIDPPAADASQAVAVRQIKEMTHLPDERIADLLGVSRQTVDNWRRGGAISSGNQERLFAVLDVLQRAMKRLATPDRLAAWLATPAGAEARTPAQLLEAGEIDRARLYAILSTSPSLGQVPTWVRRPVPKAFQAGAEHFPEALPPEQDDELFDRFGEPGGDDDDDNESDREAVLHRT